MKTLTVIPSYDCNMECSFCILNGGTKYDSEPAAFLESVNKYGKRADELFIMGGEPLLQPELMNLCALIGKTQKIPVSVFTNGTLWGPEHTQWANSNNIGVCASVHSISGEKPVKDLDIVALREVKNLTVTKVVSPDEEWADLAWTLHQLFGCKIGITLDVHHLSDFNLPSLYTFVAEYEKAGRAEWLDMIGMSAEDCTCSSHGMIEPNGKFVTRAAYLKLKKKTQPGCGRIERNMGKARYDALRKLLGKME